MLTKKELQQAMREVKTTEFHNGRPTLRHFKKNSALGERKILRVIRHLGGWPLATSFEEILAKPELYSGEVLEVARDYVAMIQPDAPPNHS